MRVMLLVGTRKGLFLMDSDPDRRDWRIRGPLCESWPVFHAIADVADGMLYAAAASEWHGTVVWHSADGGASWAPRNDGMRADWPLEDPSWGYCVHKAVFSPADADRMYTQTHVGVYRSRDAGASWTEITEGLPSEFGFPAAAHPHDRDGFYVIPVDAMQGRTAPEGQLAVWRTLDAGGTWQKL